MPDERKPLERVPVDALKAVADALDATTPRPPFTTVLTNVDLSRVNFESGQRYVIERLRAEIQRRHVQSV